MSTVTPEAAARELGAGATRPAAAEEPTIGRLVHDALGDVSSLVRNEIALAKAEVSMDVKKAGRGGAMLAAAAVMALFGVTFLLHTIAIAIAEFLPLWAGYLIDSSSNRPAPQTPCPRPPADPKASAMLSTSRSAAAKAAGSCPPITSPQWATSIGTDSTCSPASSGTT